MSFSSLKFVMAAALALTGFASNRLMAATAIVGSCPGSSYATISAAVAASPAFSIIKICPGVYPEQVVIKKPLTLVGLAVADAKNPVLQAPAGGVLVNTAYLYDGVTPVAAQIFVQNTSSVNISDIAVDGSNNGVTSCGTNLEGIYYQNASGTVDNVAVRNQALAGLAKTCFSGDGIYIESGYGTGGVANVRLTNNSIHGYQKSGITADGSGTNVRIQNNFVTGQGPTTGAPATGIEVSDGASGSVTGNTVLDNVFSGEFYASYGIYIYTSQGITISNNSLGSNQISIATVTDPTEPSLHNPNGTSDRTTITNNEITNTGVGDGIDACSNYNNITGNTITNSFVSAVHLDSLCEGTGQNNAVTLNTINDACAGVLQGGSPNLVAFNSTHNVQAEVLAGDSCAPSTPASVPAGLPQVRPRIHSPHRH
jgi:hypothetical protein